MKSDRLTDRPVFGRSSVIAICFMCAFTVLCGFLNMKLCIAGTVITIIYASVIFILAGKRSASSGNITDKTLITNITREFILKSDDAMLIMGNNNEIIWCNKNCSALCEENGSIFRKDISEIITEGYTDALPEKLRAGENVLCRVGNSNFELCGYSTMGTTHKNYCFVVLHNTDKIEELRHELLMNRTIVALLVIDNFAEATQFLGDNQRTASNAIASALDEWCEGLEGIIKEYEKNKYILLFREEKLESVLESKFDILDTIKELEVEGVSVPFTASIGIARTDSVFSEKLKLARTALDLALARGGDQAVIKTESSTEFFGGKFKSVQKRTKIRSRVIAQELRGLIESSGNVIIMGHRFCDHDSIGSCIGIAKLCEHEGKDAHIVINIHDTNLKPIFAMMSGNHKYLDLFTDAVSAQDLVRSDTLVIVCDVNNIKQFEAPEIFEAAQNVAIIDHHRKTGDYKVNPKITYIEPSSSSASELVAEILEYSLDPGSLSPFEANLLFAGIILDTKQFSKNTSISTFGAAQYLRSEGGSPTDAQRLFRTDIKDFMRESKFETDVKIHYDSIAVSKYYGATEPSDRIAMAKAADRLLGVSSIKASFVMSVIDGKACISARSDGTINVQLILESLGGGGHYDAAAAQISDVSVDEAEKMLLEACASYLGK
ncbi:MAG: DHH family phosphoesterase [Clostridia bacterium]|nr:DHH family phosphoesterase [Clostridia bacterium]